MGRTTIEVDEDTRDRLRRFKAIDGLTYDEAIEELLDAAPAVDVGADVRAPSGDGTPVECSECGHSWTYGGDKTEGQYITCSACKSNMKL